MTFEQLYIAEKLSQIDKKYKELENFLRFSKEEILVDSDITNLINSHTDFKRYSKFINEFLMIKKNG